MKTQILGKNLDQKWKKNKMTKKLKLTCNINNIKSTNIKLKLCIQEGYQKVFYSIV